MTQNAKTEVRNLRPAPRTEAGGVTIQTADAGWPVRQSPGRLADLLRLLLVLVGFSTVAFLVALLVLGIGLLVYNGRLRSDLAQERERDTEQVDRLRGQLTEQGRGAETERARLRDDLNRGIGQVRTEIHDTGEQEKKDIDGIRKELVEFKKDFKTVQDRLTASATELQKSNEKLDADVKKLTNDLDGERGKTRQLDQSLKDNQAALSKLKLDMEAKLKEKDQRIETLKANAHLHAAQEDVLIVVLSSPEFRLSDHRSVFKSLFLGADAVVAPADVFRLGLMEFVGEQSTDVVFLDKKDPTEVVEEKFRQLVAPPGGVARLKGLGKQIAQRFPDKRRKRRCILVASVTCETLPAEELNDWQEMSVHTVLVGNADNVPLSLNAKSAWWGFGQRRGAGMTVLWTDRNTGKDDLQLQADLKDCLRRLTQPQLVSDGGKAP